MKKTRLVGAILAVTTVILMSGVLQAHAATNYDIFWGYVVSPKGNVWQISTVSPLGTPLFSGRDVDPNTITATIWHECSNNPELHSHIVEPKQVVLTNKFIILVFDKATLPASAEYTVVEGMFNNAVDSFSAQGPGFVVCITGC
jgi:hypothetical protein